MTKSKLVIIDELIMADMSLLLAIEEAGSIELKTAKGHGEYILTIDNLPGTFIPTLPPKKEKYWVKFNDCYKNKRI